MVKKEYKHKIKIPKLLRDVAGYGFGIASSAYWVNVFRYFITHGGYILYEKKKWISWLEFITAILGTGFFTYKLFSMGKDNKIYKKK